VSEQTNLSSETVFKDVYTFNIQCQSAEIFLLKKKKLNELLMKNLKLEKEIHDS